MTHPLRPGIPIWAYPLAVAGFSIPAIVTLAGSPAAPLLAAVWLLALAPLFVFAYYDGAEGVSLAIALGLLVTAVVLLAGLVLGDGGPPWRGLLPVAVTLLGTAVGLALLVRRFYADIRREIDRERQLALEDGLTGLPNQRYAMLFLEAAFAGAQRGRPLVVVVFDVDRFAEYNRLHGQSAGDAALRTFGHALARTARKMDLVARHSADEFLAAIAPRVPEDALRFVERVRTELLASEQEHGRISVSAGIAPYSREYKSSQDLLAAAEKALAAAKRSGREGTVVQREPQSA